MRYSELFEAATSKLYHYTSLHNALEILKAGQFHLSIATASSDQFQPDGHFYFLSTSRSLSGEYHSPRMKSGGAGAMFNIDGDWINRRYKAKPVNYWGDRAYSEAEDRIFSKTDTMPITPVTAIHILLPSEIFSDNGELKYDHDDTYKYTRMFRDIDEFAKIHGIDIFAYYNRQYWVLQSPKGRVNLLPKPSRYDLASFIELLYKSADELSPEAKEVANTLSYDYDRNNYYRMLDAEIHNNRKGNNRGNVVKIYNFMRDNKIKNIKELLEFLANKFKA